MAAQQLLPDCYYVAIIVIAVTSDFLRMRHVWINTEKDKQLNDIMLKVVNP